MISVVWAVERVLASNCTFAKICLLLMGRVAQLGERLVRNEEAGGSNPLSSTIFQNDLERAKQFLPRHARTKFTTG